jgi:four helix bundle protein
MTNTELRNRAKSFAHRSVKLAVSLPNNALGRYLTDQLIRSSMSMSANYSAACLAQSRKEFASKISIVLEESDESKYWIEFIEDEKLIPTELLKDLKEESIILSKIFAASRITVRKNAPKSKVNNQ